MKNCIEKKTQCNYCGMIYRKYHDDDIELHMKNCDATCKHCIKPVFTDDFDIIRQQYQLSQWNCQYCQRPLDKMVSHMTYTQFDYLKKESEKQTIYEQYYKGQIKGYETIKDIHLRQCIEQCMRCHELFDSETNNTHGLLCQKVCRQCNTDYNPVIIHDHTYSCGQYFNTCIRCKKCYGKNHKNNCKYCTCGDK